MSMNDTQTTRNSLGSHERKLKYRALLEDLSTLEIENDNNIECMDKTASAVQQAQELLVDGGMEEKVKHPGEGYLDSRLLRATSDMTIRFSESVSVNANPYDKHELARHIKENPDFWCITFPREIPSMLSMFGTFEPTPPEQRPRATRRRVERQQVATLTAPEAVDKLEKQEEGSEMVSRVYRFINKWYRSNGNKPLSYFHVVLDPDSFSHTVENVYHVSFLVRDGLVAVDLDDKYELPFITPIPTSMQQEDSSDDNQFIVSLDMHRWRELIDAFKIRKPMMVLKKK